LFCQNLLTTLMLTRSWIQHCFQAKPYSNAFIGGLFDFGNVFLTLQQAGLL